MKMRLVPSEATEGMADVGQHVNSEWLNDNAPLGERRYRAPAMGTYQEMVKAAPHAGKVSAEMLEAAKVRVRDNFGCGASVDGETVYCNDERLPANIRCQSCECGDVARAAFEAIGLEVEQ